MEIKLHYDVDGEDFTTAGEASSDVKRQLRRLGVDPDIIRRVAVCMYEGEINMVIHADGGTIEVDITSERIFMILQDKGPGIPDIPSALQEGFSTANQMARDLGFGAGMGLPNMKRYADDMEVTSEVGVGTRIEITVNINA